MFLGVASLGVLASFIALHSHALRACRGVDRLAKQRLARFALHD